MTKKRMVLEIGMGTDIRGADPTKAACRALHSETSSARPIGKLARFDSVPGDSEFIPLPEEEPKPVTYPKHQRPSF